MKFKTLNDILAELSSAKYKSKINPPKGFTFATPEGILDQFHSYDGAVVSIFVVLPSSNKAGFTVELFRIDRATKNVVK